jgi:hypothetical protein
MCADEKFANEGTPSNHRSSRRFRAPELQILIAKRVRVEPWLSTRPFINIVFSNRQSDEDWHPVGASRPKDLSSEDAALGEPQIRLHHATLPARHSTSSSVQHQASDRQNLPGTVIRVETHVTRRKQTTGYPSTRNLACINAPHNPHWQLSVTRRKSSCAWRPALCYSVGVPPSGTCATAPARPSNRCLAALTRPTGSGGLPLPNFPLSRSSQECFGTQPGAQQPASPNYAKACRGIAEIRIGMLG